MRLPQYKVWQSEHSKEWFFSLVAGNGEVQHSSEGYTSKKDAIRAIKSIRRNSIIARIVVY